MSTSKLAAYAEAALGRFAVKELPVLITTVPLPTGMLADTPAVSTTLFMIARAFWATF